MTRAPTEIDPQSAPALAALQDLIYQEDTPKSEHLPIFPLSLLTSYILPLCPGRALAHKEDGNEHFRKKRYRQAVETYSAAINQGCKDRELRAILFCNRATSQYHLGELTSDPCSAPHCSGFHDTSGNFRSALVDAGEAHRSNGEYMKAIVRGQVRLFPCEEKSVYICDVCSYCSVGVLCEVEEVQRGSEMV